MTSTLDRPDCPTVVHGPAEVRAAMVACTNELGIKSFDRNMDAAYKDGPEALRKYLDYWWYCTQIARGEIAPPRTSGNAMEETIKAWEAKHPGQRLPRAA